MAGDGVAAVLVPQKCKSSTSNEAASKYEPKNIPFDKVIVHPLVLLSVVDHFNRVSKNFGQTKRVLGVLLGSGAHRELDVANSFAVPFDEDDKAADVWFLDHDYLNSMYEMFHKVAAKERIVGWYHTGPKLNPNDISINGKLKTLCRNPVLVVVDVQPKGQGLPTEAYIEVEQVHDDGTPPVKTFEHLPSEIGAEEAEEVGVEHLLRDIKDQTAGTLSQRVTDQYEGLRGLQKNIQGISNYLAAVGKGQLPMNHHINYLLQDALNLLPDNENSELVRSHNMQMNDQMCAMYIASLARSVIALHNLIDNKLTVRKAEEELEDGAEKKEKEKENKESKEKEKEDKKDGDKKSEDTKAKQK